jgi:soluble lytic murein transglycosylase-like protein
VARAVRAAALAGALAPLATTNAQEGIYVTRPAQGQPLYTDSPRPGATLLMSLPEPPPARPAFGRAAPASRGDTTIDPVILSLVQQAARRHALDIELLLAVIRQESGFDRMAVSRAGARGLMQLMPGTATRYGVQRIHDAGENIAGGSAYLRDLLDEFGRTDLALAAYNAGEGAVRRYGNRIPPFDETVNYVASVMADYQARKARR